MSAERKNVLTMYSNLYDFRLLLKILADLVDESIISEWQAGLMTGAFCMKNGISPFDFGLYNSADIFNIQNLPSEPKKEN